MRIEVINQSKYRHSLRPGDDVPLILPGAVYGVFDGATDARGTRVDGIGAGRLAAETVARAMARLAAEPDVRSWPAERIVEHLSQALADRTAPLGLPIPPSTTMAVVLDCGSDWRFLLLGDSGIRLNGSEVLLREKLIDTVSTLGRVAVFRDLASRIADPDDVEAAAREAILLGFDRAVETGMMPRARIEEIITDVIRETGLEKHADLVEGFLRGGIQVQFHFGNADGNPLCFDTLNGNRPLLGETIDVTCPKAGLSSIEIFTDGYVAMPAHASVAAWEAAFEAAESQDFHKLDRYAGVKGSTSREVFDDRTVIVMGDLQ
ncbi:hypothetical protein JQU17_10745 [Ponticoccus sp. SC2-23]|uniref:hypothetical protein n=1 Tax=Alexandriicola marinus TaxID=2081710 RepID=UPI000FD8AFE9|nr:hypothetical protein [Alexandriicola marinus]MBM1221368.1 hypothetical protein [Ponticoccus sp. SC6-9]MBM1226409.1 hypothetical protein [Ponticoccus sp. SC6-15]MBM1230360.1 hypothetical protein [Ponticoccus sp. SC6-38]MBM1234883.1 hypothetical protein [Ponticoccus sp. SC6-45]MBM1239381.1 hypothetical protein [Ponticoccus sp. SC6-49]MBM1243163.1 hypothetical protein [Ponticoccus sp. SC2-64]MBM1248407.1 hypothetical protein [Ponticoccus sp. SC6-42]MBM1252992.1 hypothetical protein [Pontico